MKPVLIVGAGPTGLMAAFELTRRNIPVEIIDAGEGPTPEHESRALAVHARTLDLFARNGLEDTVLAAGNKVFGADFQFGSKPLAQFDFAAAGTNRPYIFVIPQGTTERILIDALRERGVEVRWQTKCLGVESTEAPQATIQSEGAEPIKIRADFVVGADGARSVVRQAIGATFDGETEPQTFGLVDVRNSEAINPNRFVANRLPTGMLGRIPINDRVARYISDRPDVVEMLPDDPGVEEIVWRSTFRVSYRHVDTYQKGRVFVMGDAAHLHSPAGGRGMNLGLEDAAWFAHAFENGLLNDFTAARLPYAKHTLKVSKRMMNSAVNNNPIANAAFRYLVPMAFGVGMITRNVARLILAEELPRPPFHG